MKTFISDDFLLSNKYSKELYHKHSENVPIIDYHCHIDAADIANNVQYCNITELWLKGDHYKWRFMRANGVDEKYITGDATDYEKFAAYVKVLSKAVGNPLYHWSHLEVKRYFDYNEALTEENTLDAWNFINSKIQEKHICARSLMEASNVKLICTTDDPISDLKYHKQIANDASFNIKVLPAFRPDNALIIKDSFYPYIDELSRVSQLQIKTIADLKNALISRINYFEENGCKVSDHGLDYVPYKKVSDEEVDAIWEKIITHTAISTDEQAMFQSYMMKFLSSEYCKRNWVMQLHFGCRRNNNSKMFNLIGADTGFDCINEPVPLNQVIQLLDELNSSNALPKTILYSLNPNDNAILDSICGCFQDSTAISKIQHGCAWWFNDHKKGIVEMIDTLAMMGNLSGFVGMLTDSRSFLSYTRHEYFRRLLCEYLGRLIENGEFAADMDTMGKIVEDISFNNTNTYFNFNII